MTKAVLTLRNSCTGWAEEFTSRNVEFLKSIKDSEDGDDGFHDVIVGLVDHAALTSHLPKAREPSMPDSDWAQTSTPRASEARWSPSRAPSTKTAVL